MEDVADAANGAFDVRGDVAVVVPVAQPAASTEIATALTRRIALAPMLIHL
jgi:hypothetical protein